jgi:chromosome segregation ATPase
MTAQYNKLFSDSTLNLFHASILPYIKVNEREGGRKEEKEKEKREKSERKEKREKRKERVRNTKSNFKSKFQGYPAKIENATKKYTVNKAKLEKHRPKLDAKKAKLSDLNLQYEHSHTKAQDLWDEIAAWGRKVPFYIYICFILFA